MQNPPTSPLCHLRMAGTRHSTQLCPPRRQGSCDTAQATRGQSSPQAPLKHIKYSVLSYRAGKHQESLEDKQLCYQAFIIRNESTQLNTSVLHWLQGHTCIEIPSRFRALVCTSITATARSSEGFPGKPRSSTRTGSLGLPLCSALWMLLRERWRDFSYLLIRRVVYIF